MRKEYDTLKTLGPRAAQLFTGLQERGQVTFTVADVQEITGLQLATARSLVQKARSRGLVTRLKSGLYNLVPFEMGRATQFVAHPYLIARDVMRGSPHFLSHSTAMEIHRMTTQPNLEIYVSSSQRFRPQTIGGYRFRFVSVPSEKLFGMASHWVTKEHSVTVSDIERTVIDGLRLPEYAGGVTEVARGMWMKRDQLDVQRCIEYAKRLDITAVIVRLGFLLEQYSLADEPALRTLRARRGTTYHRLDPTLAAEGSRIASWRLQLNVTPEELQATRFG